MSRKGFTLIEVLLSFSICLLIIFNTVSLLELTDVKDSHTYSDISMGVKQLHNYLLTAQIESYNETLVYKDREEQTNQVFYDNHRLVKTPGYETLIYDIDNISYFKDNDYLCLTVTRNEKDYTYVIGDLLIKEDDMLGEDIIEEEG